MNKPQKTASDPKLWNSDLFPKLAIPKDEAALILDFCQNPALNQTQRAAILGEARTIATKARAAGSLVSAEKIMAIYKLSTAEGRMIMEMAEALLRIPDTTTRDYLIFDKLASGHWLNSGAKGFTIGMERALELASGIVRAKHQDGLKAIVSKLGVPAVRHAIETAMRQMGGQFVFSETIEQAIKKIKNAPESKALYSFDMLGEAARSQQDCDQYFSAYMQAISAVGAASQHDDANLNSGISVKLSALCCRFEARYWSESSTALIDQVKKLAIKARQYNIPLTLDAEEFGKLQLSLHVLAHLLNDPALKGWSGLGIVVQAYSRYAGSVIGWLRQQAQQHNIRIPVRLVKGAYWDTEIKIAQEKGLDDFPVYTAKNHTDIAYLAYAKQLMQDSQYFLPQFASHNAYTLTAITHLANGIKPHSFELQKLHGMGDAVYGEIQKISAAPLRIYAPVGRHKDLLAYLVRRILENGASSSFMNNFADDRVDVKDLVFDPYDRPRKEEPPLACGSQLFAPSRKNSLGFDQDNAETIAHFAHIVQPDILPPKPIDASHEDISAAFQHAAQSKWGQTPPSKRAAILDKVADLFEQNQDQIYPILVHEAGKTIEDAAGELREAVDFCRYYAAQIKQLDAPPPMREPPMHEIVPRGVVVAISPWNFPLAIFTGQIIAALAAGNAVIAKPAEQTPRIAALAVDLMHQAGIPKDTMQLLCGNGSNIGQALTASGKADMVVFTGSTSTAKRIEGAIANSIKPHAPLIAETGGLNAMIVDGSALLERVVDDVLASAFQSAGQRCSALRVLYIQAEIAETLLKMLCESATMLKTGNPANMDTDVGPIIDQDAKKRIDQHIEQARLEHRLIWQGNAPKEGNFCAPTIIRIDGIEALESEIFGPVLHICTYQAGSETHIIDAINQSAYGLTFGIHSRIDANIKRVSERINAGNVYVNRNQIGAIVGSQPFGGHELSGTGPKAGGALYVHAFMTSPSASIEASNAATLLPGPSGEQNSYETQPRQRKILICHADQAMRTKLANIAKAYGNLVEETDHIPDHDDFDAVMSLDDGNMNIQEIRCKLHKISKRIIPLIMDEGGHIWLKQEKHICRDMTASGGNIDLLMR